MRRIILIFLLINWRIRSFSGEKSSIITHCKWYNRFDLVGVVFNCNESSNEIETHEKIYKNQQLYFSDSDGLDCYKENRSLHRYCSKQMIDAIRFEKCHLYHIPYGTFKAYPYLRVLDISQLGLDSLQPEHLVGAKRAWDLMAGNNELKEIPTSLFATAGSVTKVDLSYNKIRRIEAQHFIGANELKMLDLSGNQIVALDEHAFEGLVNLTHMNLAYNRINEFHPFSFVGLKRLYHLDLSHNSISMLKDRTFANLSRLNQLQLSYNQINQIESFAFADAHSLLRLDLSHNNISDEQIFDNLYNLMHLDLSHNPINEIGIGTFAKLIKLEHLDLGHTNLTDIELGTFSYQRGLISLDLSENNLKTLDFGLFLPAFRYMDSLYLDGNQLSDMNGFNNSLFPRLNALGITNNKFNCTYLKRFMRSVAWEQIRLPVDRMPLNIHRTNIRGVACDANETITPSKNRSGLNEAPDNVKLNEAIETLIKHLPAADQTEGDSDVKVIKLQRENGSKVMILVW